MHLYIEQALCFWAGKTEQDQVGGWYVLNGVCSRCATMGLKPVPGGTTSGKLSALAAHPAAGALAGVGQIAAKIAFWSTIFALHAKARCRPRSGLFPCVRSLQIHVPFSFPQKNVRRTRNDPDPGQNP